MGKPKSVDQLRDAATKCHDAILGLDRQKIILESAHRAHVAKLLGKCNIGRNLKFDGEFDAVCRTLSYLSDAERQQAADDTSPNSKFTGDILRIKFDLTIARDSLIWAAGMTWKDFEEWYG